MKTRRSFFTRVDGAVWAAIAVMAAVGYFLIPSPEPAQAQFTEQRAWGGTAGGSANSLTVSVANYTKQVGVPIRFVAASQNTSSVLLNVTSTGASAVKRATNVGAADLVGGEWSAGTVVTVLWDGTNYKLLDRFDMVGTPVNFRQSTVPPGHLAEDGSCVSRSASATVALFAAIGTTYGVCDGSTTFALPDSRGRADVALDNQGGAGAAGRVTTGGSGCNLISQIGCGLQTGALTSVNQLPAYTPGGTINPGTYTPAGNLGGSVNVNITDSRTWTTAQAVVFNNIGPGPFSTPSAGANWSVGASAVTVNSGSISGSTAALNTGGTFTGTSQAFTFFGTPVGTGAAFAVLQPLLGTIRAIKL